MYKEEEGVQRGGRLEGKSWVARGNGSGDAGNGLVVIQAGLVKVSAEAVVSCRC